ncbi:helix-turn-helix domain-containing protein [Lachnoclostridium sp. An138]|uniref:helix-turn-helix domain-containing protein n=1 Tax=Lachnoclostridium sp. An138 TaxID=1965560 RepID=UPI000B3A9792|nr:helix-turn-helix transcriptional regulator [Lachnoclostridium sp. An138]OUQ16549.1 hypothetical protein B5E82_12940 [Lachnoclostridium sp. An138]
MDQDRQIYDRCGAGKRMRMRREELGLARSEIAERIGKAEKYYADIERGYCGMSLDTLVEIAGCLGVATDYIIFGKQEDREYPDEAGGILFFLQNCEEDKRKKAVKLLQLYLSD